MPLSRAISIEATPTAKHLVSLVSQLSFITASLFKITSNKATVYLLLQGVHRRVIHELLRPRMWRAQEDRSLFILDMKEILSLCEMSIKIFEKEPTVLRLRGRAFLSSTRRPAACLHALAAMPMHACSKATANCSKSRASLLLMGLAQAPLHGLVLVALHV